MDNYGPRAELLTPAYQAKAYALVFAPLAIGTALLVWPFRTRKPSKPSPPPSR